MGISYEDFDLRIVADGAGYCVLADSPKVSSAISLYFQLR
jgi:hypothetical protein